MGKGNGGRNEICSCGSGRKYKKCCGAGNQLQWFPARRLLIPLILILGPCIVYTRSILSSPSVQGDATPRVELTPETEVLAYVGGKNDWQRKQLRELEKGQEFQFDHHLCYIDPDGLIRMNPEVDVALFPEADRTFERDNGRFPEAEDVVRP